MEFLMPIPPKPPWHVMSTAIESLPTAVPISCNSLFESPTDKSNATTDCNIENNQNYDRPDNDHDNDVNFFFRKDKQPVPPQQDISPTTPTANNTPLV